MTKTRTPADRVPMDKPTIPAKRRVLRPVSTATGGLKPGIDLTRISDIQEMEDLEYIERMRKGFKWAFGEVCRVR
jgi:hypothetical protein